jgi:hypothetical protein
LGTDYACKPGEYYAIGHAYWCEQEGHEVTLITYTGLEDISRELPQDVDLVFICSFTQAAQLAYAISNQMHQKALRGSNEVAA